MKKYKIRCPLCKGILEVQDNWANLEIPCPYCKNNLRIPPPKHHADCREKPYTETTRQNEKSDFSKVSIDNSEQLKNLILQGNRFLKSEEYEEAEDVFSKVLAIDSNNLEAQFGRGIATGWQSDFGKPRFTAINTVMDFLIANNLPQHVLAKKISELLQAFNKMSSTRFDDIAGEYRRRLGAGSLEYLANLNRGAFVQRHEAEEDLKNYKRDYAKFVSALAKSGDKLLAKINHDFAVQYFREDYKETRRLMTYYYSAVSDKEIREYVPQDIINIANVNAGRNMEILKQLDPDLQLQQQNDIGCGSWLGIGAVIVFAVIFMASCLAKC